MSNPDLRPYARPHDLAPRDPQRLPAHVDGQLHILPPTLFLLGCICGAGFFGLCEFLLRLLFSTPSP
jgi:hypothetical protein